MNRQDQRNTTQKPLNLKYYFIVAAIATAIAGIVHLYMPLIAHPQMFHNIPNVTFFLGSGIVQLFWVIPIIRRWGNIWYYVGIVGNIAFILLYIVTRFPGNPVNGRGGDVDMVDLTCEFAQLAYIAITSIIIAKENKLKHIVKEKIE
jgi:hypothetical protein